MKLLIVIADYAKADKLKKNSGYASEFPLPFAFFAHGHGSADSKLLELLGLGDNKKTVAVIPIANDKVKAAYKHLDNSLNLKHAGTGIAFTVPLSVISRTFAKFITGDNMDTTTQHAPRPGEREEIARAPYELILTIVEPDLADAVKEAAHSVGARGGTVLHGLGMAKDEAAEFFGIKVQSERAVVLIVAAKEDVRPIMQKIAEKCGINTPGKGICFSVPVDSALGLAEKAEPEAEDE